MQPDEIQTLILAYVSGVNEAKILYNNYSPKEKELVEQAIDLIEKYQHNFMIEYIPDPSIHQVRTLITKYVLNKNVAHIFYDYIFSSPGLLGEFRDIKVREDVALMMLSNTLKEIASTYNVYIQSATQLNEKWEKAMVRNQNHLRGSKAIADKVDIGMISIKLDEHPEEEAVIRNIIENSQMNLAMPNIVIDIYKNRRGQYTNVKILRYFDYGTCRVIKDIAMLTSTHKILDNYNTIEYETTERDLLDIITEIRGVKHE
jgi:replicative DNA helicase